MMKMKPILLKTACLWLLLSGSAFCESAFPELKGAPLKEMALIQLPDDGRDWKEDSRILTEDYSEVSYIPADQDPDNTSELVTVVTKKCKDRNRGAMSMDKCAASMKLAALIAFPEKKLTWEALRIGEFDLLYESILHSKLKDVPPFHELTRLFLTEEGYIEITFIRMYKQMSKEEKAKWIDALENRVTVLFKTGPSTEVKQTDSAPV